MERGGGEGRSGEEWEGSREIRRGGSREKVVGGVGKAVGCV